MYKHFISTYKSRVSCIVMIYKKLKRKNRASLYMQNIEHEGVLYFVPNINNHHPSSVHLVLCD